MTTQPRELRVITAKIGIALIAVLATLWGLRPPHPTPATAAPSEFSAERAFAHVQYLARAPHPSGSAEHARVRGRIVQSLRRAGFEPQVRESTACTWSAGANHCARVFNVYATLVGRSSNHAIMLSAHYDAVEHSLGANDDGSGVAVLLETARALKQGPPLENAILFAFVDAEERGLMGAEAFTREHPDRAKVRVVLNFEARGARGPSAMYALSQPNGWLVDAFAQVPYPVGNSLLAVLANALPNDSDATVYGAAGLDTMAFAYVDGFERYHRPSDTPRAMSLASLEHHGTYALTLARQLGNTSTEQVNRQRQRVYFDVLGRAIVSYPVWVSHALVVLGIVLYVWALRRRGLASRSGILAIARGAGGLLGAAVLMGVSTSIVGLMLVLAHPDALLGSTGIWCMTALLASGGPWLWCVLRLHRSLRLETLELGAVGGWLLLGTITAVVKPLAAFVFQWPVVLLSLGIVLRDRAPRLGLAAECIAAAVSAWFGTHLVYTLIVMVGGKSPGVPVLVAGLVLALFVGCARLRYPLRVRASPWLVLFAMPCAVMSGWLAWHAMHHLSRFDSLIYTLDTNTRAARWVSLDRHADAFTAPYLDATSPAEQPQLEWDGSLRRSGAAPPLSLVGPQVTVMNEEVRADRRRLRLAVRSLRGARLIALWTPGEADVRVLSVDGGPVRQLIRFAPELDTKLFNLATGAGPKNPWNLTFVAPPATGFEVELDVPAGRLLELRVADSSDGLPTLGVVRPQGLLPLITSDRIVVSSSRRLE